jgi:hypothetical protein
MVGQGLVSDVGLWPGLEIASAIARSLGGRAAFDALPISLSKDNDANRRGHALLKVEHAARREFPHAATLLDFLCVEA